jgi:hypothetical protein
VAFADSARCVLPLVDITEVEEFPKLVPGRETRFAPMFDLLTDLTSTDAAAHLASGVFAYRPRTSPCPPRADDRHGRG